MGNAIMIKGLEGKPKATGTFSVVNGFDKPTITHNLGTQNIFYTFQLADGVQVTDPYRCVSGLGFNPSKIFENRTYKNQSGNDVPMFPLGGEVFGRNYLGAIITTNTSLYSYVANNSNNDIQDITDNSFVIGHRYSFEPNAIYNWSVYSLDSGGQSDDIDIIEKTMESTIRCQNITWEHNLGVVPKAVILDCANPSTPTTNYNFYGATYHDYGGSKYIKDYRYINTSGTNSNAGNLDITLTDTSVIIGSQSNAISYFVGGDTYKLTVIK